MADNESNKAGMSAALGELSQEIDSAVESATERLAAARDAGTNILDDEIEEKLGTEDGDGEAPESADPELEGEEKRPDPSGDATEDKGPARGADGRFTVAGPSEATIERAVRLGIPLAEAKQFPSEALLAATCGRIEGPRAEGSKDSGSPEGAGKKEGEAEPDLLESIPDLDPAVYDEKIVKAFAALKGFARSQQATIAELRGGQDKTWLSAKLDSVKDLTKGDQAKTGALKAKFDVLKAGYKSAGQAVDDDAVFEEAAKLVLGAEVEAARRDRQAAQARGRSGQRIQRPTGRRVEAKPDALAEVAEAIDRKFFS